MCKANENELASNTFLTEGVGDISLHFLHQHVLGWMNSGADPWGHVKSVKGQLTSFLFSFPPSVLPLNPHAIASNFPHSDWKSLLGNSWWQPFSVVHCFHIGIIVLLLYEMKHIFSSHWLWLVYVTCFDQWQVETCGICQVHAEVKPYSMFPSCIKLFIQSKKK